MSWIAFALIFALFFAFASPSFVAALRRFTVNRLRGGLLAAALLIPYLLVALPQAQDNAGEFLGGLARMAAYLAVPTIAMLFRRAERKPFDLFDITAILALWFPIEFDWLPDAPLRLAGISLPLAKLLAVDLAFLLFLVIRPLEGLGYSFRLRGADFTTVSLALTAYSVIGLPLGLLARFLIFGLAPFRPLEWLLGLVFGYLLVALPEELLFRGIIQNMLQQRWGKTWATLLAAAVIFGLAHLNNATTNYPEPNWMYAVMATLAGLAYGWTWRRTGKITASAATHALVNFVWGIVFGG